MVVENQLQRQKSPHQPKYSHDKDRSYEGDPWSRQKFETSRSFAAFQKYIELGENRTIAKTAEIVGTTPGSMGAWSAKHRWVERAEAYDAFLDALRMSKLRRKKIRAAEKHAEDAEKLQEVLMRPTEKLRERLAAALDGEADWLDGLDEEQLTRVAKAFGESLPALQKAERDALTSVSDIPVRDTKAKMKGMVLKRILGDATMTGMVEQTVFALEEELPTTDE